MGGILIFSKIPFSSEAAEILYMMSRLILICIEKVFNGLAAMATIER